MPVFMVYDVSFGCEVSFTEFALIGLISCMRAHVNREVCLASERFPAVLELADEGFVLDSVLP